MRYLAFVSYAHRDAPRAHWLHRAIETYRLPRRLSRERGLPVRPGRLFLDRSELPSSSSLSAAIQAALTEAENLLLICSPAAAASRWVNEEVRRFRDLRGRDRIFCLIVDGDPALRDGPGGCFPPALLAPEPGDEQPVEPLAADVRGGQDRPSDARLKLIAGMLDVEFDALRQRDQGRRLRRLTVAAATLAIVAAALLALAITATLSRNEARRQAETARRTSQFLRELLTSADPTAARGREVTVRELVDRGAAEVGTDPTLHDQPLVRADLLATLAEAYAVLGQYRSAERLLGNAALTGRSDARVEAVRTKVGAEIANNDGRFAKARTLVARALAMQPRPTPDRTLLLLDRAFAERGLDDDAAADRSLAQALADARAQQPPYLEGVERALKEIAKRHFEQGRYPVATAELEALLRSRRRLGAGVDPLAGEAYNELGAIRYKQGDNGAARRWFEQALAIETRVLGESDPKIATARGNLARIMVEQREFAPALQLLATARTAIVAEQGGQAAVLAWQDDSIGLAEQGLGRWAAAEAAFRRGLTIARRAHAAKAPDLLVDLAALLCATRRAGAAAPLLAEATADYAKAAAPPNGMLARADQVRGQCLMHVGDRSAGAALVRRAAPAVLARWGAASLFGAEAQAALAATR